MLTVAFLVARDIYVPFPFVIVELMLKDTLFPNEKYDKNCAHIFTISKKHCFRGHKTIHLEKI